MTQQTDMRTPIGKVRGLGSAKEGVNHWIAQRLTALALIPLALWFAFSIACLVGADYATFKAWLSQPLNTGLMVLFLGAMFWHSMLGLQVVIEDYVEPEGAKIIALVLSKLFHVALAVITLLAVLRVAFAGG